eukprot:m.17777 g.17777  ORF g.17777 m.17777 type:complete len:96 (+) comp11670_c0_seq1:51-338(+)
MSNRDKLQTTQDQVDEVVGIMKGNMDKVLERDAKLSDLEDTSDKLVDGANRFQVTSKRLKNQMWWQNARWWIIIIFVVLVIIGIIVGVSVSNNKK